MYELLKGSRALDLTDECGYLCGLMLAQIGVEVVKVEKPEGDRGRRLGGKARVRKLAKRPVDDSGRSMAQYWAQVGWFKLIEKHGRKEAGRIMARRGTEAWNRERKAYSRYLGEMRRLTGNVETDSLS